MGLSQPDRNTLRWWNSPQFKRIFDVILSVLIVIGFAPILLLIPLIIRLDSRGPAIFRDQRVGLGGRPFTLYKFRTMVSNAKELSNVVSTPDNDPRITRFGRVLRRYNLDEFPQFFNVVKGDMSIVGPRPEVPQYVAMFSKLEKRILSVRPGLTDLATLWIGDKGLRLRNSKDPEKTYIEEIRPEKLRLQLEYINTRSLVVDIRIIWTTFWTHLASKLLDARNLQ